MIMLIIHSKFIVPSRRLLRLPFTDDVSRKLATEVVICVGSKLGQIWQSVERGADLRLRLLWPRSTPQGAQIVVWQILSFDYFPISTTSCQSRRRTALGNFAEVINSSPVIDRACKQRLRHNPNTIRRGVCYDVAVDLQSVWCYNESVLLLIPFVGISTDC